MDEQNSPGAVAAASGAQAFGSRQNLSSHSATGCYFQSADFKLEGSGE
jgi:hypothetical protein